jgi:transposase InsO family protein
MKLFLVALFKMFSRKADLVAENVSLRQQLAIYKRKHKRIPIKNSDRVFWVFVSKVWSKWKTALIIVKPETVVRWHRNLFKIYWRWKSRKKSGRPKINKELQQLIRRMQLENPTWSAQRIHGELLKLNYEVSDRTVAKYMLKIHKPPSQSWRNFLTNHACKIAAIDFFTVITINFKILYVFVAIEHGRRKILHFNVTSKPSALWAAQQLRETFDWGSSIKYVIRDNDGIYGDLFKRQLNTLGLEDTPTAPRSPWQNPVCERVIGTLRRECLDHMIILTENHLWKILSEYIPYYNISRTHMSLNKDSPNGRAVHTTGRIISKSILGGLHHEYSRAS